MRRPIRLIPATALAAWGALVVAPRADAQSRAPDVRAEAVTGGEVESYLRVLQVAGIAPLYPWSIRGFSPREVDRLLPASTTHPWARRLPPADSAARHRLVLLRPEVEGLFNSAFPFGVNDGPVWAGRGVTGVATAGAELRWGVLTLRAEPMVFWAQNRSFALMPNTDAGHPFNDPDNPLTIDLPQRFGNGSFARFDPGQSYARVDVAGVAVGFSTANEQWGPTVDLPLVLGTNAAGFPHAFLGTSTPWNVGIGRIHARVEWGSLAQSDYSTVQGDGSRRLMTGVVAVFTPRGLPGLELGGSRFFQSSWPAGGLGFHDLTEPFQALFKAHVGDSGDPSGGNNTPANQLASAFARLVLPRGGVEVWGEYAHEDYNWDLQDFFLEPDHTAGYTLGLRKVLVRRSSLLSVRAELLDTQPGNLQIVRNQGQFYRHTVERQGHTYLGQILGSPAAYGGAGSVLALDGYTSRGRWTVDWTRSRIRSLPPTASGDSTRVDVLSSLGAQAVIFHGLGDGIVGVRGVYELNRNGGGDAFNLSANVGIRIGF